MPANSNSRRINIPAGAIKKVSPSLNTQYKQPAGDVKKLPAGGLPGAAAIQNELAKLRAAAAAIQQIRLSAQRELEIAKQIRAEAQKYQQETETRALSQAHQLILHTRLTTHKETEELIRKASAEIQKVLADIRVIRITAQEELAAQRNFTDAARISRLSFDAQRDKAAPESGKGKQPRRKK